MNQKEIADLFGTTKHNISMHISNIFDDNEVDDRCYQYFLTHLHDGREYLVKEFNLNMILAIGYRIRTKIANAFRNWVTQLLISYARDGYIIDKNVLYFRDERLDKLEYDVAIIKSDIKELKNISALTVREKMFIENKYFEVDVFFEEILRSANESVILVDPYLDEKGLAYLSKVSDSIKRTIYYSKGIGKLHTVEIADFQKQYGNLTAINMDKFHDRLIIIDNKICYVIGASFNRAGSKIFLVHKVEDEEIVNDLLSELKS